MKIIHTSDLHGNFNILYEACLQPSDLVVITGDFFPEYLDAQVEKQVEMLSANRNQMLTSLNGRPLIYVQGNHDWVNLNTLNYDKAFELNNSGLSMFGYAWYGFPNTQDLPSQAHYADNLQPMVDAIPTNTDILLTHAPPNHILDLKEGVNHGGIKHLTRKIADTDIVLHMFGHAHQSSGILVEDHTIYSNAALTWRIIRI